MWLMIVGAVLIGVTLGLMGSGGSILTVPVLVYVLGHDKDLAVAESMAIVGLIALVAAIPNAIGKQIDWKNVLFFGIPGMVGTFLGAWIGAHYFTGSAKLFFFALVMLVAAWSMFRKKDPDENDSDNPSQSNERKPKIGRIAVDGTVVGIVTGIVGVGGGFLIVPALVLLGGLNMRIAVGTSLAVIVLKCLVGFAEYQYEFVQQGLSVDWPTILIFSLVGSLGSFLGRTISQSINQATLRKVFAVVLIVMAILILGKEIPQLVTHAAGHSETVASLTSII